MSDFDEAVKMFALIGAREKAYQETLREIWELNDVEMMIDTWPFLETIIEIEGKSESQVKDVADSLGFDWSNAKFCCIGTIYADKYNISEDRINNHTPKIVFDMENPFV